MPDFRILFYSSHHFRHKLIGLIEVRVPAVIFAEAGTASPLGGCIHEMVHLLAAPCNFTRAGYLSKTAGQLLEDV
ncbi:hypothetical protein D3C81_868090 [compost metagenome]